MRRIRSSLVGPAHLYLPGIKGDLGALQVAVTRVDGARLTLRVLRNGALAAGQRCVLSVSTEEGCRRARVRVTEVHDLTAGAELEEPLSPPERRAWPRAEVVLRYMVRRLEANERRPSGHKMSLVPSSGAWHTEEVVLSGTGVCVPLGSDFRLGDLAELRLHIPGLAGGDHFVTTAEVVALVDDVAPVEHVLKFVDLDDAAMARIGELVDQARLEDLFDVAW